MALPGPKKGSVKPTRMMKLDKEQLQDLMTGLYGLHAARAQFRRIRGHVKNPKADETAKLYHKLEDALMSLVLAEKKND